MKKLKIVKFCFRGVEGNPHKFLKNSRIDSGMSFLELGDLLQPDVIYYTILQKKIIFGEAGQELHFGGPLSGISGVL